MANRVLEELNKILNILKMFPEGANIEEIRKSLSHALAFRTLQRYLKILVDQKKILSEGKARARKYKLITSDITKEKQSKGSILILSKEAQKIQLRVTKPIQKRASVNYHQKFLDSYKPNTTFYLSKILRKKLFEMGKTPDGRYPAGTYAKQIFHRLLIDLSWNSSRLEGNTYSLLETERLLDLGIVSEGKDAKDAQMILNHKAAIEFLIESANEIEINRYIILNLHALLSDNLLTDRACGSLRAIAVKIGMSSYVPLSIPQLLSENFEKLLKKANAIKDPFEQAFFLMVQLPYLQPFEDVNKRTSRLAANIALIKKNLCPLSFIDVSEKDYINGLLGIYEQNRIELLRDIFVWAYERSCFLYSTTRNVLGEPDVFRMKYRDSIVEVISEIVKKGMNKSQAILLIQRKAQKLIPSKDSSRFIEIVERELQSLHEGSIARYRLRLSEYESWKRKWI
ncbi:MAG: hypothetical protein KR126chlam4_00613 [Candidatus Anoxychlamydiales bacterium]|nr:hypothetical protein [Candidatus Anoxychlamydiales bacterium]NGX40782.1 hypothetical protein [Candidatus Anoxychlamydiales bacterium]HEU64538.1 Fic family protein [Chlamydiota bacterium]